MVAEASEATRVHDPPEALAGGDVRPPWSSCCTASNGECPMEEHWENQESTALATTCFERSVATRVRDFPDPLAGADVRPPWGSCCTATNGECLMEEHGEHQASTTLATTCLERPVAAGDAQYTGDQDRAPGSMGLLAAEDRGFAERVRDNEKKLELALACLARIEERMLREARELAPARDPHAASPRARPRSRFRLRIMQQVEMDAESPGAAPRPAAPQVPAGLTPRPLGERDGSDSPCTSSPAVSCILPASSLQRAPDFYYLEGDTIPDAKAHVGKEDTDALLDPGSRACSS